MQINFEVQRGQTLLEIGAGPGQFTRQLASQLIAAGGGRLIVNDIQSTFFEVLEAELAQPLLELSFIRGSATGLPQLRPAMADQVVFGFSLAAIDAVHGQAAQALTRAFQLLKPGGRLKIIEVLPVYMAANPAQQIWARQTALLHAAQTLALRRPPKSFQPDQLLALLQILGFEDAEDEDALQLKPSQEWWPPYVQTLQKALEGLPENARDFFLSYAQTLNDEAQALGSLELPCYILSALKPWRTEI